MFADVLEMGMHTAARFVLLTPSPFLVLAHVHACAVPHNDLDFLAVVAVLENKKYFLLRCLRMRKIFLLLVDCF